MSIIRVVSSVLVCLALASPVHAESAGAADAGRLLSMLRAEKLTAPVYFQVQQMFAQRFAESSAPESRRALLERYQAKANGLLEQAVGWKRIEPEMIALYTEAFSAEELKELVAFYQSPLGRKLLERMPELSARSAQSIQARLEKAAPQINRLLDEMSAELGAKPAAGAKQ